MQEPKRPPTSDAEREVLSALWDNGPQTVRGTMGVLNEQGKDWKRSTVITLLQRLERKGYVLSDKSSNSFIFRAAVTRQQEIHARMVGLADELCDGDAFPLMLAFADQHRFTAAELKRFRELIDATQTKRKRRRP